MKPLLKIEEADVLQSGVFPSLPENQLALWREGSNFVFYDGRVSKLKSYTVLGIQDTRVVAFAQSFVYPNERIYFGTPVEVFKYELGAAVSLGDGFGGSEWSLEPWGSWLVATNDFDVPQVWKNAGSLVPLAGVEFTTVKIFKKLANHLLAFNTSIDGTEVRWCSKSNIELWIPDTDNSAGGTPVRELDSEILAAEYLNDGIGFYSENSFGMVRYVGGSFVFSVLKVLDGIGAVGKDSIVQVANEHFGFGAQGIFRNNGVSFTYIGTPAVERWLRENLDLEFKAETRGVHYQAKNVVLWSFVAKDETRKLIGYNYKTGAWLTGEYGATAFDEPTVKDGNPLVAVGAGWGVFDDNSGTELDATLLTAPLDAGDQNRWKLWNMLEVEFQGEAEVRFGFKEAPQAETEWEDWVELARENWIDREAPFMQVEFRASSDFEISGIEAFGSITAYQR